MSTEHSIKFSPLTQEAYKAQAVPFIKFCHRKPYSDHHMSKGSGYSSLTIQKLNNETQSQQMKVIGETNRTDDTLEIVKNREKSHSEQVSTGIELEKSSNQVPTLLPKVKNQNQSQKMDSNVASKGSDVSYSCLSSTFPDSKPTAEVNVSDENVLRAQTDTTGERTLHEKPAEPEKTQSLSSVITSVICNKSGTEDGTVNFLPDSHIRPGVDDNCNDTESDSDCLSEPKKFFDGSVESFGDCHSEPVLEVQDDAEKKEGCCVYVPPVKTPAEDPVNFQARLRRSSSLKTTKSVSDAAGSKKIVRFADALGLDLADVRTFLDDVPRVPSSAYKDLQFDFSSPFEPSAPPLTLVPLFQQPGRQMDFMERVHQQNICLETILITDATVLAAAGFVRVRNLGYHKSVYVRYTLTNWENYSDLLASYVPDSCDGFTDKFSFVIYGHKLKEGDKMEFALRFDCCGNQYWDNNGGINYAFNCLPETSANSFFSSRYET